MAAREALNVQEGPPSHEPGCWQGKGSLYHLIKIGARFHPLETAFALAAPFIFYQVEQYREVFMANMIAQIIWFIPVANLPAFLTGHMTYVDIAWPGGLVILSGFLMFGADGWWVRRWAVSGCFFLHGFRMFFGALVMFFPWRWDEDLPRYQLAKKRFIEVDGLSPSLWCLKQHHDIFQQCFANICPLAAAVMCAAFDAHPAVRPLEVIGFLIWIGSWVTENRADIQKLKFMSEAKKNPGVKSVLGYEPYDGPEYSLWTASRHPNYFCEWMSWNGFMLVGISSLIYLEQDPLIKIGLGLIMLLASRFFYDCLLYWTGAMPAEHFSEQKREAYTEYQKKTRVFWLFEVPFFDHGRRAGWAAF